MFRFQVQPYSFSGRHPQGGGRFFVFGHFRAIWRHLSVSAINLSSAFQSCLKSSFLLK